MRNLLRGIAMAIVLWPLTTHAAGTCRAESGDRVVPLVELYTSEGCSSCPPADRWLSTHFPAGDAAAGSVALAFHVDYWDRLGWKDRFATPAFTERQYQAMRANRSTFVYTPQVVVQGKDYANWRRGAPAIADAASREARARIAVQATVETSSIVVQADAKLAEAPRRETSIAFAYADSRITSDVESGENRGEKLVHDHVVRAFETRPLKAIVGSFSVRLPRPKEAGTYPMIVTFVQDVASGDVLQTLAVPLQGCL